MRVGTLPIDSTHIATLHPQERALVATARETRVIEFATGRALLRELLGTSTAVTRADNGAPKWPAGLVGSLAHDRDQAVAAVASSAQYRAIGIDVEPHGSGDDELRESVLRADDPDIDPTAAFVMKEAAYKAWSDVGGEPVGPLAVRVQVEGDGFTAEMPDGSNIAGTLQDTGDSWIALATIPI